MSVAAPARASAPAAAPPRESRWPFSPWHLVLAPIAFVFAIPLLWLLISSLMTNAQINRFPPTIIPDSLHLVGYRFVIENALFPRWFLNSAIVSLTTVTSNLVFCSLAGYAFARLHFRGSTTLLVLMLATLVVPFQLTMIPTFLVMKQLGLIDSLGALIVPSLVTPFGVFLLRQFFVVAAARARGGRVDRRLLAAEDPLTDRAAAGAAGAGDRRRAHVPADRGTTSSGR